MILDRPVTPTTEFCCWQSPNRTLDCVRNSQPSAISGEIRPMQDRWNRRDVLGAGIITGAAIALRPLVWSEEPPSTLRLEDRMTPYPATWYRPYVSRPATDASSSAWVQIDLGSAIQIDALRLYPNFDDARKSLGFPARLRGEGADTPAFETASLLFD